MKKFLAMLLSVLMLVSCCAVAVAADDGYFNDGEMEWGENSGNGDNQYNDDVLDWSEYMGLFEIGSAEAAAGDTVVIPVSITKNPGIISLKLGINYDAAALELISVEAGEFAIASGEISYGPTEANPFIINWNDALATVENEQIGVVAYLTFKVKENAASGASALSITYNPNDVFDFNMTNVEFLTKDGTITIAGAYLPGDVNNDGKVNVRDLGALQQHINGWDTAINEAAADVTGDGKINVRDLGLLQQFMNGWDVTLK